MNVQSCASVLLTRWRKKAGITQEAAAARIKVRQATWSGYESGRQTPRTEKALEIESMTDGEVPVPAWVKPASDAPDEPADAPSATGTDGGGS